jgi:hypothetical protein
MIRVNPPRQFLDLIYTGTPNVWRDDSHQHPSLLAVDANEAAPCNQAKQKLFDVLTVMVGRLS